MKNATVECGLMDRKIISVTGKRQITIPLKFYQHLKLGKEVECCLTDGALVIKPLSRDDGNFTMEILRDLVSQGYNGEELLEKFDEQRKTIQKAIGILIDEAGEIARGNRKGATTRDIFGED